MAISLKFRNFTAAVRKPYLGLFALLNPGDDPFDWIESIADPSAPSDVFLNADLVGDFDGVNATFTVPAPPGVYNYIQVYRDGVHLTNQVGSDGFTWSQAIGGEITVVFNANNIPIAGTLVEIDAWLTSA